jgi:uncharacterized repeat protein (TIGR01451 family)
MATAAPSVTISAPGQALIGTQVKFKLKFVTGNVTGFGPFVDLVLDAGGANAAKSCACDGISFFSAKWIGVNGGPIDLAPIGPTPQLTAPCGTAPATVTHSFSASGVGPVTLPPGGQLITLQLPFGSVVTSQPSFEIEVTANISNLADMNYPLKIYARAGYQYGQNPLDNPIPDPPLMSDLTPNATGWSGQAQITPVVMLTKKSYLGPEGENATGPNFIGFYPLRYKLTIDIAPGQTLTNVTLTDGLPSNMAFHSLVSISPLGTTTLPPIDVPSSSGFLVAHWNTLSGGAVIVFDFFISEKDAFGNPVLPANCNPAISKDTLNVTASWVPLDSCDTSPQALSQGPVVDNLLDKCIAIQKSVAIAMDNNAPGLTPGDVLQYTLNFQISDYKTIGSLVVNDMLANGQDFISPAVLTLSDQFGSKSGPIPAAFISQSQDKQGAAHFCPAELQQPVNGTLLTFNISQAMAVIPGFASPRLNAGIMTGGFAAMSSSSMPATGTITFRAQVRDDFQYPVAPGDSYVDKEDPINNCVAINGKVFQNVKPSVMPITVLTGATDRSATGLMIVPDTLEKKVIAVKHGAGFVCGGTSGLNCSNSPNSPQEVRAGDQVTFSLTKRVPSSDAEQLTIEDWLPLPVFDVTGMTFSNSSCAGAAGLPLNTNTACLGPGDQMHTLVPAKPSFAVNAGMNSIKFDYSPGFNDPNNLPRTIELRFTSTVTNQPFADNLYLTNEAQECEANTFGVTFCQIAIAQINLREPKLLIKKGIIATDNQKGTFTHQGQTATNLSLAQAPSGVTFSLSGVGGVVNHGAFQSGMLDSDLSNVDAGDIVTFLVTVENVGGADAFDAKIEDIIPNNAGSPTCFSILPGTFQIKRGDGMVLPSFMYTLGFPIPTGGFTLSANPGVPVPKFHPTSGTNIVTIAFQAKLIQKIQPGCCDNEVDLRQYASQIGGPDFVAAGFTPPFKDTARICVEVKASKCVTRTSEPHTLANSSNSGNVNVAIGEIVRYQLWTKIPEGTNNYLSVTDHLPAGMTYMNDGTTKVAYVSDGGLSVSGLSGPGLLVNGGSKGCGLTTPTFTLPSPNILGGPFVSDTDPSFYLGLINNADSDPNDEFVIVEFNALVNNLPQNALGLPNQNGTILSNTYEVFLGKSIVGQLKPPVATSAPVNVTVVEPHLLLTKTASPTTVTPGGSVTFTITALNNGTADAFDVVLIDNLPTGLTFVSGSLQPTQPIGCASPVISGNSVNVPKIPVQCMVTVNFQVKVTGHCPSDFLNRVQANYTSLPGLYTPLGPNNTTGSQTPGTSGADNGERQYTTSATAVIVCTMGQQFGSLTVIKKIISPQGMPPPSTAVFPVTLSCQPSGYNQVLNLSLGVLTQTFNGVPVGNTCTVTEAPLPAPVATPVCATMGWWPPQYNPQQTVSITGAPQSITIVNRFGCLTNSKPEK